MWLESLHIRLSTRRTGSLTCTGRTPVSAISCTCSVSALMQDFPAAPPERGPCPCRSMGAPHHCGWHCGCVCACLKIALEKTQYSNTDLSSVSVCFFGQKVTRSCTIFLMAQIALLTLDCCMQQRPVYSSLESRRQASYL